MWPRHFTLRYILKRTESKDSNRYLYTNVHSSIFHRSQKETSTCQSADKWINKMWSFNMVEYYLPLGKEWSSGICCNVDEPWKHYATWDIPDTEGQRLWSHVHKGLRIVTSEKQSGGFPKLGKGSDCLRIMEFLFEMMKNFWKILVMTAQHLYFMPLNWILIELKTHIRWNAVTFNLPQLKKPAWIALFWLQISLWSKENGVMYQMRNLFSDPGGTW